MSSGSSLSLSSRPSRRRGFDPRQLTELSKWLSWADATDSGTLTVPDRKGGSGATQASAGLKPVISVIDGITVGTFNAKVLSLALDAAVNDNAKFSVAFWAKHANITGTKTLLTIQNLAGGASADKLLYLLIGSTLQVRALGVDRRAQILPVDTNWRFSYLGIDGSKATEALKVLMGLGGAFDPNVFFSSDTAWPATLGTPTGNMLIGAGTAAGASGVVASFGDLLFFSDQLSAAKVAQVRDYTRPKLTLSGGNVVCLGNSITQGAGLSSGQDYPTVLQGLLGSTWRTTNAGHSGERTTQLISNFTNYAGVEHWPGAARNILVVNEVGNDLINGASEATARTNMQTLIALGRAAGFAVWFATTTPRTAPNFSAGQQAAANNINAYFRSNPSESDGIIDWAADSRLDDASDLSFYQADGVHPAAAGASAIASTTQAALTA